MTETFNGIPVCDACGEQGDHCGNCECCSGMRYPWARLYELIYGRKRGK